MTVMMMVMMMMIIIRMIIMMMYSLLVADRPPAVTILTLVRDAVSRLPNGEGTR